MDGTKQCSVFGVARRLHSRAFLGPVMRHEVGVDETAMNVLEAGCSVDEPLAIVPELWTRARNAG